MKEIKIIAKGDTAGAYYANVFESLVDGSKLEEETTEGVYKSLSAANPKNPTKAGYKWLYAFSDHRYDTPSGRFEDNCYLSCWLIKQGDKIIRVHEDPTKP